MLDSREFLRKEQPKVKTILIVEDDTAIGEFLVLVLREETPYQALLVPDSFQALKMVGSLNPDLFVLDYQLPNMNGIDLYDQLHAMDGLEDISALFISAYVPVEAFEKRGVSSLKKPVELDELLQTIEKLLTE